MKIPWLALAIGLLVYLITSSIIAAVAVFIGSQVFLLLFVGTLVALAAAANDQWGKR